MHFIKKIGFFSALILPFLLVTGFSLGGSGIFAIHIFTFILVPLLDVLISKDQQNVAEVDIPIISKERFYNGVLYFWTFVQFGVLLWALYQVSNSSFGFLEYFALATGTALVTGGIGITVAHELGHKKGKVDQLFAKSLLMMVCYMHFLIEHNRGHHVRVATKDDPASSRYGEHFYAFWWRSVKDGYFSAWQLEKERLEKKGLAFWSSDNQMLLFLVAPLIFIGALSFVFFFVSGFFSWQIPLFFFVQSVLAFSLLEIVNYIEHYGMERKLMPNGRYERVNPLHSWNASQRISNFLLFQLQRHSDHHAYAHKPFQVLDHYEESPQLPAGYSAMIILAMFPPFWFAVMHPILHSWKTKTYSMDFGNIKSSEI